MKKTLERLNGEKFASYALEAQTMFSIVGATPPGVDNTPTGSGGSTNKLVASVCNLGFSHASTDWASDQTPVDVDAEIKKEKG